MTRAVDTAARTRELTDVVSRLRRALRRSIRSDYPWEARPMAQIEVLQTLGDRPAGAAEDGAGVRLGDLAARLNLAQSTVSTLVGRLLADGLLERSVDPRDRRAAVVALSPAGREHLAEWDRAHQRRLQAALNSLPAAERNRVIAAVPALAQLVAALEAGDDVIASR